LLFFTSCKSNEQQESDFSKHCSIEAKWPPNLLLPPLVPKPIGDRKATKLIVNMEILEKEGEMADGVRYVFWTFGGSVPGSFIRTRVGDEVEFHLKNHPDNKLTPQH
jgi:nitrite reductase (NO-forming)